MFFERKYHHPTLKKAGSKRVAKRTRRKNIHANIHADMVDWKAQPVTPAACGVRFDHFDTLKYAPARSTQISETKMHNIPARILFSVAAAFHTRDMASANDTRTLPTKGRVKRTAMPTTRTHTLRARTSSVNKTAYSSTVLESCAAQDSVSGVVASRKQTLSSDTRRRGCMHTTRTSTVSSECPTSKT